MRNRLLLALTALLLALTARTGAAQTALRLRWALVGDSQAAFTLTNRDTKPLPRADGRSTSVRCTPPIRAAWEPGSTSRTY